MLDVAIQPQIFELMERRRREHETAIMLFTHDTGTVARPADDVAVMYMGNMAKRTQSTTFYGDKMQPYT